MKKIVNGALALAAVAAGASLVFSLSTGVKSFRELQDGAVAAAKSAAKASADLAEAVEPTAHAQPVGGYYTPITLFTASWGTNRIAGGTSLTNWQRIDCTYQKDAAIQAECQVVGTGSNTSYLLIYHSVDPTTYTNGQTAAINTMELFCKLTLTPTTATTTFSAMTNCGSVLATSVGAYPYLFIGPLTNAEVGANYMTNVVVRVYTK